jgi:hypothetical protein
MSANIPGAATPPSTYLTGIGGLLEGVDVGSFLTSIGDGKAQLAVAAFGGLLIAVGAWLHQIGH